MASKLKALICPSILNTDLSQLANECKKLTDAGADYLHLDVMDGHFVPNFTFGPPLIECLRKNMGADAKLDVHMMVDDPKKWLEHMHKAGIDQYTFHLEADKLREKETQTNEAAVNELIDMVKSKGIRCGLSIKPTTGVEKLMPFGAKIDTALIMTVEPGHGGQKFMENQLEKVRELRKKYPELNIQVDGGVGLGNIELCAKAGANMIVSGTGIVRSVDPRETMQNMRDSIENALRIVANV